MTIECVRRDGKVAVLVSKGFGAGWYTWADGHGLTKEQHVAMLFDPELVAAVLGEGDGVPMEIAARKWPDVYTGGVGKLVVEWLDPGTQFEMHEYDGAESIRVLEQMDFVTVP